MSTIPNQPKGTNMKRFKHLGKLLAILLLAIALFNLRVINFSGAILIVGCWQLLQFAMSKRCGVCFTTALTPEQIKEFGDILSSFKGYDGMFKDLADLAKVEGGFAAIKKLPELLKTEQK